MSGALFVAAVLAVWGLIEVALYVRRRRLRRTYRSVAIFDLDDGPLEQVAFVEAPEDTP